MLNEYVLIFDPGAYSANVPSFVETCLDHLVEPLRAEGLVRDLRGGEWSAFCAGQIGRWHPRARQLLTKLHRQNRLHQAPAATPVPPNNAQDWCFEALASHAVDPLDGIIASHSTKSQFLREGLVASIERLGATPWWQIRGSTVSVQRSTNAYILRLERVFRCANSLIFIDAYIDPSKLNYREFNRLLLAVGGRVPTPLIEIHRVCYEGSGRNRQILDRPEWEDRFSGLGQDLENAGLNATVFIWDDHHDRYLITDLVGINLPYGFDISGNPSAKTTWTRLERPTRDDIQREFDRNSGAHTVHYTFTIGAV